MKPNTEKARYEQMESTLRKTRRLGRIERCKALVNLLAASRPPERDFEFNATMDELTRWIMDLSGK